MAVPFVDSLTTNLDHSLPLTVGEFDEFGNAKEKLPKVYGNKAKTFYCNCDYQKKTIKLKENSPRYQPVYTNQHFFRNLDLL